MFWHGHESCCWSWHCSCCFPSFGFEDDFDLKLTLRLDYDAVFSLVFDLVDDRFVVSLVGGHDLDVGIVLLVS